MYSLPNSLRIGVLRGGPSPKYSDSLQNGSFILENLSETHRPVDIFISSDGKWHVQGMERSPERILKNIDVVWNGLEGPFGEDGCVQGILDNVGALYTGSGKLESAICMNRHMIKERAQALGIKTPVSLLVRETDSLSEKAKEIWNSIPNPLVVKPAKGGYSLYYKKVSSYRDLLSALEEVLAGHDSALVEEYISGKLTNSSVLEDFRGKEFYTFPAIEISGMLPIYPTSFSEATNKEMEIASRLIHKNLGLRHYSSSDFIVSPRRGVYLLEVSTSPKLGEKSSILKSLESVGVSVKDFLHHTIGLALNKK